MDHFFFVWLICVVCTVLTFEIVCIVAPILNSYYYLFAKYSFCLVIGHFFFLFTKENVFKKQVNPNKKAVFVTGCDSGFGLQLAKRLDSKGYRVFAGCLFPESGGAAELKKSCSSRLCTIHLDVRQDDSVQIAKEFVEKNLEDCELWAIVNNAGVLKTLTVEYSPISDYVHSLQVNTMGQVRVTKAFLPLIRKSKGRIVNMNSLSGRTAAPHLSCYTMSKFAAVAFTECLRREMNPTGVKVISIEPEMFKTPMSDLKNMNKQLETAKDGAKENFESSSGKKIIQRTKLLHAFADKINSSNIHIVVDAMDAAVSMQYPCPIYQPCGNKIRQLVVYFIIHIPDHILDAFYEIINWTFKS